MRARHVFSPPHTHTDKRGATITRPPQNRRSMYSPHLFPAQGRRPTPALPCEPESAPGTSGAAGEGAHPHRHPRPLGQPALRLPCRCCCYAARQGARVLGARLLARGFRWPPLSRRNAPGRSWGCALQLLQVCALPQCHLPPCSWHALRRTACCCEMPSGAEAAAAAAAARRSPPWCCLFA